MIELDSGDAAAVRSAIEAPGGFLWWYVEILDTAGTGVVAIWSFGLPFLPGYASRSRAGRPERPGDRPSLNVATYEHGRLKSYALREFSPHEVAWDGAGAWRFGASTITTEDVRGERFVELDLDLLMTSGEHLRGAIRAAGPVPAVRSRLGLALTPHYWTPLIASGFGTAIVRIDERAHCVRVAGPAYHDRNRSAAPLHDLGFDRWLWGHLRDGDTDRIAYVMWPRGNREPVAFGIELRADMPVQAERLDATLLGHRCARFGMRTWEAVKLGRPGERRPWLEFPLERCVDDGPFYLRYVAPSGASGALEVIDPDSIDLARHRRLVKMRIDSGPDTSSMWLPLFQGSPAGRPGRLLRSIVGKATAALPRR